VLWSPSAGGTAVFAAGSDATGTYAVTVSGTQDIGGMIVEEGDVSLSGGGLQMTSDSQLSVASGATGTVSSLISNDSTRQLSKSGDGTLALSGSNTYTGVTRVLEGALSVASLANAGADSAIGNYPTAGADGLILAGTLEYTGGTATSDRGFTMSADSTIDVSAAGTALTLGDSAASLAGTLTITGGAGSTLSLGNVRVIEGANLTLNPTTEALTVASVEGYTGYPVGNATITLGGTAAGNVVSGVITRSIPPGTPYSRGLHVVKSDSSDWTVLGGVGPDSGNMTVNEGTLTLSGSGNYSGATKAYGGTLIAGTNAPRNSNGAFGKSTKELELGLPNGNDDATLLIGGPYTVGLYVRVNSQNTTDSGTRVLTLGGNTADASAFSGPVYLGDNNNAGYGVTLTAASGGTVSFDGVIQDPSGMDATAYTVTKAGLGTVALTNANTYSGETKVSAGTLSLGDGTNNSTLSDYGTLSVETGAVLDLNFASGDPDTVLILNIGGSAKAAGQYGHSSTGVNNGGDGVGAYDLFFAPNTGIINNLGGVLVNEFLWDGGSVDIVGDGDASSDGGAGTWDATIKNWDIGFTDHAAWGNTTADKAVFGGTTNNSIVTLDSDMNIGCGITGSPTMNSEGRQDHNSTLELVPTADVSQTLGALNTFRNINRNTRVDLGGESAGNSVGPITWQNVGQQLTLTKKGSSTWTVTGGWDNSPNGDSRWVVDEGTLILDGTFNPSHQLDVLAGGTLKGNATLSVARTGTTEHVRVLAGGTMAPGTSVGTININDKTEIDGTLEIEVDGANADLLAITGDLDLSDGANTIKVVELGAATLTDYLVVTYTGSLTGTFTNEDLPAGYSVDYGTAGEIHLLVAGGADPYGAWATLNGVSGGFDGDDDGGGTSNGAEWYYFNSDPQVVEGNGSPLTGATKTGANTFVFTHMRPLDRTGVSDPYQWSSALSTWNASGASEGPITVDIVAVGDAGDPYETVTVTATVSGGTMDELFVRQELSYP